MFPLDGVAFTRLVRTSPDSPNAYLPIIMMTGHSERARVYEARDAGVNEFVVKPITAKAVLDRINAVILRPRAFIKAEHYVGPCRRRREPGGLRRAVPALYGRGAIQRRIDLVRPALVDPEPVDRMRAHPILDEAVGGLDPGQDVGGLVLAVADADRLMRRDPEPGVGQAHHRKGCITVSNRAASRAAPGDAFTGWPKNCTSGP